MNTTLPRPVDITIHTAKILSLQFPNLTAKDTELVGYECFNQGATSNDQINGMLKAYDYAKTFATSKTRAESGVGDILILEQELQSFIEPDHVKYRIVPVYFKDLTFAPAPELLGSLMENWATGLANGWYPPHVSYFLYESAHPHVDGNGRNGLCTWAIDNYWYYGRWPTTLPPMYATMKTLAMKGSL